MKKKIFGIPVAVILLVVLSVSVAAASFATIRTVKNKFWDNDETGCLHLNMDVQVNPDGNAYWHCLDCGIERCNSNYPCMRNMSTVKMVLIVKYVDGETEEFTDVVSIYQDANTTIVAVCHDNFETIELHQLFITEKYGDENCTLLTSNKKYYLDTKTLQLKPYTPETTTSK